MKKISRKLLMSIFSMAFAIIALGTTTFAWFTMNSTATAEIEVGVQSGTEGILLSTDCKEFNATNPWLPKVMLGINTDTTQVLFC